MSVILSVYTDRWAVPRQLCKWSIEVVLRQVKEYYCNCVSSQVVDGRTEHYKPGQVCQATVLQVMDGGQLELSLIGL